MFRRLPRPIPSRSSFLRLTALALATLVALCGPPVEAKKANDAAADLAAARALFQKNLDAIADRDSETYLSCYLDAETLARTGPTGFELGYDGLAESVGTGWPVVFDAKDLRLIPVRPGVVYGTYRYRVVFENGDGEGGAGPSEATGISERLFVETPKGWKIAVTSAFEAPAGTPPPPLALVGGTLVDGTGAEPVADSVVVLRGGTVDCAGSREACPVPDGVTVQDVSGHWVTPGLIDAHVHFSQTGWADGRPDSLDVRERYPYADVIAAQKAHPERWFRSYLCSGVTSVFDVGGYPWTLDLPERTRWDTLAPRVTAAGPLLSTWDFWLNLPAERQFVYLADGDVGRDGVRYLTERGSQAIKVWFIPIEERDFAEMEAAVLAAGEAAKARGVPLIVHATGLREAKVALRAGAHLLVHSVWDQPVDEEFLRLARDNGTVYNPTLTVPAGYQRMYEAAAHDTDPEIDDPNGCVGSGIRARIAETKTFDGPSLQRLDLRREATERRARVGAANLKTVHDAGIPVAMGTDAGNPLTLHGPSVYVEMEAMEAAGLTPMEVLVAATFGGARAMRREGELGTVETGKMADLAVLAADPTASASAFRQVRYVVRGGVLRAVSELRVWPPAGEGLSLEP